MPKEVNVTYNPARHSSEQVRNYVVFPFMEEQTGLYEDLDDHWRGTETSSDLFNDLHGVTFELGMASKKDFEKYIQDKRLDVQKLGSGTYFLRSLRKKL